MSLFSDQKIEEYIAHARGAVRSGRVDIRIDSLALISLLMEIKRRRELTGYLKAGYRPDNVFVQRLIAETEQSSGR